VRSLDGRVDLILDGGPCPGGLESTVVDVSGSVVRVAPPWTGDRRPNSKRSSAKWNRPWPADPLTGRLPSPGMLARHYAAADGAECAPGPAEADFLAGVYETAGLKVAG
jgi:L-threonylcarbamoyladenylate synthase